MPENLLSATPRAEFLVGARDTLPLVIGGVPFGIIFGAVAVTSGVSAGAALGMSAFVYAGSAQFIATGLVAAGASIPVIVLTTFVVNLRHALYGASLGPYMKHLPQRWLIPLAFLLTDETFLVVVRRWEDHVLGPPQTHTHWYHLGSAVFMYVVWQLCTALGVVAGQSIPDPRQWGLDFAMIVTFIGMLVSLVKSRSVLVSVMVAGVTATIAYPLENQLGLIVAALAGVLAGMVARGVYGETDEVRPQPAVAAESEPSQP